MMTEFEQEVLDVYNSLPRIKSLLLRILQNHGYNPADRKEKVKKCYEKRAELNMILHNLGMCQMTKESLMRMYEAQEELKEIERELND